MLDEEKWSWPSGVVDHRWWPNKSNPNYVNALLSISNKFFTFAGGAHVNEQFSLSAHNSQTAALLVDTYRSLH